MCYYRGYYSGNNYNASVVWPQFVLMLCLLGKNSGGQSIRWSPGYRESIDTWGDWEGDRGLSDQICLVPPAQSEKIEIFTINSLTEICWGTLFSTILRSFLIFIWTKYFVYEQVVGGPWWPQSTDLLDVFTVVNSLNIVLTQLLIPALTYQHPSLRQPSSPSVAQ